jgi:hypothetical protein
VAVINKKSTAISSAFSNVMVSQLKTVHKFGELRFVIRSFILVYNVFLCQTVQHAGDLLQQFLSLSLVGSTTQLLNKSSGGFVLIPVS